MYSDKRIVKWETVISTASKIKAVAIIDDGELIIGFEEPDNIDVYRKRIQFDVYGS
jgi:hypothetical protein